MKKLKITIISAILITAFFATSCSQSDMNSTAVSDSTSSMDFSFSERDLDWSYDKSNATTIKLSDSEAEILGSGVKTDDSGIVITKEGTYIISGSGIDTMITVDADDKDKIQIVLAGASVENSKGPAIYSKSADKVFLTIEEDTVNTLSDGSSYSITDDEATLDGAVFSRTDFTVNGTGTLNISGNYKHAVVSKDDLIVVACTLNTKSENAGLNGKDCVKIGYGTVNITAGSDGIRSDNEEDSTRGFVYIEQSSLEINAGNDGIQAETVLKANEADISIISGGGSNVSLTDSEESYKGLKAGTDMLLSKGTYIIDSLDDAIHCNNTITISGGNFEISSGDDGIHADNDLSVSDGTITVSKSYEGLEGSRIVISGGDIDITSSDDGLNAVGSDDNTSTERKMPQDSFASLTGEILISGGNIVIDAAGDGIDSNGTLTLSGGTVLVSGPTDSGNSALDCDGGSKVTGGTLVALGSSGMAEGFSEAENQGAILYSFSTQSAGTVFALSDPEGNEIVSFTPGKPYQSAVVTSPEIQIGSSYTLSAGGVKIATIEMSSALYNAGGMGMGAMGGPQGNTPPDRMHGDDRGGHI